MLLPDTVGTGGDSHTRFPIGISFPAGSGLVAFAAATGDEREQGERERREKLRSTATCISRDKANRACVRSCGACIVVFVASKPPSKPSTHHHHCVTVASPDTRVRASRVPCPVLVCRGTRPAPPCSQATCRLTCPSRCSCASRATSSQASPSVTSCTPSRECRRCVGDGRVKGNSKSSSTSSWVLLRQNHASATNLTVPHRSSRGCRCIISGTMRSSRAC